MDLTQYMSGAIEQLVSDALKASLRNPRESAFLLRFMQAQKSAAKLRTAAEENGRHIPPFLIASITNPL